MSKLRLTAGVVGLGMLAALVAPVATSGARAETPDPAADQQGSAARAALVRPSDEFTGSRLVACRWNDIYQEDPELYEVADGQLTVTTSPGDFFGTDNSTEVRNLFLQTADHAAEDYVLETELSTTFTDGYSQGGLMVFADPDNYVKLVAIAYPVAGRANYLELTPEVDGWSEEQLRYDVPAGTTSYRLRLTKVGHVYTGEASFDGGAWEQVGTVENPTPQMSFGLGTLGVNQPGTTATFDYFRVTGDQPGSQVDSRAPKLRVIKPKGTTKNRRPRIVARVRDQCANASGVARRGITVRLDGKKQRFAYKTKKNATIGRIKARPNKRLKPGKHTVRIVIEDRAGNKTARAWKFRVKKRRR